MNINCKSFTQALYSRETCLVNSICFVTCGPVSMALIHVFKIGGTDSPCVFCLFVSEFPIQHFRHINSSLFFVLFSALSASSSFISRNLVSLLMIYDSSDHSHISHSSEGTLLWRLHFSSAWCKLNEHDPQ